MRTAYSVETVRAAERALMDRLPDGALMQRAAAGLAAACADVLRRRGRVYGARVVLLVGSGDNGGDALYAGARLARRGAGVRAVLTSPGRAHEGGLAALLAAGGRVAGGEGDTGGDGETGGDGDTGDGSPFAAAWGGHVDLVVDGITGIGGRGGLRPQAAALVRAFEATGVAFVAVDLPSGVEADTGEVLGDAVRADATVTFGTYKPGLLIDPAHAAWRARCTSSTSGSARSCPRCPAWRRCSTRTSPHSCPSPVVRATSTGAVSSASSPGRRGIRERRCWPSPGRCGAVPERCGTSVRAPVR